MSNDRVLQEVNSGLGAVQEECSRTLRQECDAWQQSHQLLMKVAAPRCRQIEGFTAQFHATNIPAARTNDDALSEGKDFDEKAASLGQTMKELMLRSDAALRERVAGDAKKRRERDFASWQQRSGHIEQQIIELEAKRNNELPWSEVALLPARNEFFDGRPESVKAFLALGSRDLKEQEDKEKEPQAIFLARALINYKAALEELDPELKHQVQKWEPAWNAEKAIFRASRQARSIALQDSQQELLRTALVNKAYACDVLLRTHGAQAGYDLVEIAYYLNEIMDCSRRLGPPFSDMLSPLIAEYTKRLDNRAPMSD